MAAEDENTISRFSFITGYFYFYLSAFHNNVIWVGWFLLRRATTVECFSKYHRSRLSLLPGNKTISTIFQMKHRREITENENIPRRSIGGRRPKSRPRNGGRNNIKTNKKKFHLSRRHNGTIIQPQLIPRNEINKSNLFGTTKWASGHAYKLDVHVLLRSPTTRTGLERRQARGAPRTDSQARSQEQPPRRWGMFTYRGFGKWRETNFILLRLNIQRDILMSGNVTAALQRVEIFLNLLKCFGNIFKLLIVLLRYSWVPL